MNTYRSPGAFDVKDLPETFLTGKCWFLGIGISNYQDTKFDRLPNAKKDVEDIAKLLIEKYGFLTNQDFLLFEEDASKKKILKLLKDLCNPSSEIKENDRLIIYFAGHGTYDALSKQGFWVPHCAEYEDDSCYFAFPNLIKYFNNIQCRHLLVIADCCFSEYLTERGGDAAPETELLDWDVQPSRKVLTSGRDKVLDGKPGENSPFAKAILEVLSENQVPLLSQDLLKKVKTLIDRVYEQKTRFEKIPNAFDRGGQLIFFPIGNEEKEWESVKNQPTEEVLVRYLEKFPKGKNASEVVTILDRIRAEKALQLANTRYDLRLFISHYDKYVDLIEVAHERIDCLDDDKAWSEALESKRYKLVCDYIKNFKKNGRHIKEAEQLKLEIEDNWEKPSNPPEPEKKEPEPPEPKEKFIAPKHKPSYVQALYNINDLMIPIKGGIFEMGDLGGDFKGVGWPVQKITISNFGLCPYPVTQGQWQEIMGDNPSKCTSNEDLPVEQVSWQDANRFIKELNNKTGMRYRLPTEAEWEFAARGGVKSEKYKFSGSNQLEKVGWFGENSPVGNPENSLFRYSVADKSTQPVCLLDPNELGLYDMSGNVWEWCEDDWESGYQHLPLNGAARIISNNKAKVIRGGSFLERKVNCLVANRKGSPPDVKSMIDTGFRLAHPGS